MPDYTQRIKALRALGAPNSGATEAERKLANEKADELEAKYGPKFKAYEYDTTTTSRDGRFNPFQRPPGFQESNFSSVFDDLIREARLRQAQRIAEDLARNQWAWNTEYYDRDGNPKPQKSRQPDVDNIYEEAYKYDPYHTYEDEEDYEDDE